MGSGKSSWAIQTMKENEDKNYMYITPFLNEVDRIIQATKDKKCFVQPVNKGKGKLSSLNKSIVNEDDIASTHELFKHLDEDSKKALLFNHYTLILDEVLDVVEPYSIKADDLNVLKESGWVSIREDGFLEWNRHIDNYDGTFDEIKRLAENHSLLFINNTILLWRYQPEIFSLFDEVYILTYMFEASILKYYFDYYEIAYEKKGIRLLENGRYEVCDYAKPDVAVYRDLINLYDGELNSSFIQKASCMSKSWFRNSENKSKIKKIRDNIYNYLRNQQHAKSETIMWTTFKDYNKSLGGKGYSKGFLSFNCRSTNEYSDRYNLVYALNLYLNPGIPDFFKKKHIQINQNQYALSEMLQWIWRSRIRNGLPVNIYVPVRRMRDLLKKWLDEEDIPTFYG